MGDVEAVPSSMTDAAGTLHGVARDLQLEQLDPALVDAAGEPAAHPEVAAAMRAFGGFAADQYRDAVALLAALSSGVQTTATDYSWTDHGAAQQIEKFMTESTFVPPG